MNGDDQLRELMLLVCGARGYSPEQTAQVLYDLDHPPAIGSPEWVVEQAELHLALEEAREHNRRMERELSTTRDDHVSTYNPHHLNGRRNR